VVETLKLYGIDESEVNNLTSILDTCEYARFSPASSEAEAEKIYEGTAGFISLVENTIR
jgi:hypothetical protein